MEDLGLRALYRCVAGIDVHRMLHVVTVVVEQPDGSMQRHTREFGGFRRDCRALAAWLGELGVELVIMQSTGIYWKSVHAHLENAGIAAWVVNAHMIKHVPSQGKGPLPLMRKTDMADTEWLAVLARFGLVRASLIPPKGLRELRLVSRYRRKLTHMHSAEVNRLHKVLDDGSVKLGGVVSDINGVSARAMVCALIEGGGTEPGQQRERGQAQVRAHAPRQFDHPLHLVRMRQCRAHDQEHAGVQVQEPDGAQVAQESHHRGGPQDDPADLHPAESTTGLHRSGHRLRRDECEEERAALDQAAQGHRPLAVAQTRRSQRLIRR